MRKSVLLLLFALVCCLPEGHGQAPIPEGARIGKVPVGVNYQVGPGGKNSSLKWTYPRGTKMTVKQNGHRNFELAATGRLGKGFVFRQYINAEKRWTPWLSLVTGDGAGRYGIGTSSPRNTLDINGTMRSQQLFVEAAPWPDYVFSPDYALAPLADTEGYSADHGHLPGIPSAETVASDGVALGAINAKLLEKIEELTLHAIRQGKAIDRLRRENQSLKRVAARFAALEEKIDQLDNQ